MNIDEPSQLEINNIINLVSSKAYLEALELANNLLKDYQKNPILLNIIGACYAGLGDLGSAKKFYNKAILVKPDYAKAHFNLGGTLHNMGELENAINSFMISLQHDPDYAEAHNNLGNVYREVGELDLAVKSFENAIKLRSEYLEAHYSLGLVLQSLDLPDSVHHFEKVLSLKPHFAEAHNNLGVAYKGQGQFNRAEKSYIKALTIKPNYIEAHNNLGNVLREIGQIDEAVLCYEKAIALTPDYPTTYNNLGNAQKDLSQLNKAIESYQKGLSYNPDNPETLSNLGIAYRDNGQFDKAIESYKKAISIDPQNSNIYNNLGIAYRDSGQYDNAIESYKNSLSMEPENSDAHNNLGIALKESGHPNEAIQHYKKALKIKPHDYDTYNNLGIIFSELGQLDKAIKSYEDALLINPDYEAAYNNISLILTKLNRLQEAHIYNKKALTINPKFAEGFATQGYIFTEMNKLDQALDSLEKANNINSELPYNIGTILSTKMSLCLWNNLSDELDELRTRINNNERVIVPFDLLSLIDDPELQGKASFIYANDNFKKNTTFSNISFHSRNKTIRIAYFSADFRIHPVATLTAELYEAHNRDQFEIHAFSFGPDTNDEMNLRIKEGVDHFHEVFQMSNQEIVLLARSLEIDIAVDLGGYTADSRTGIFSMMAAPIQICYIGVLSTMGASYYDYLVAGHGMIPKKNQKYFSEKIVYLPSYQVNDSQESPPAIFFTRKDFGLSTENFVFACFNNTFKITPFIFDSWARILHSVKNSVMMIYVSNKSAQKNLTKEIINRGIDSKRLIFTEKLTRNEYLARFRLADLFLDTHPYNAGTTASDALRMGLPVLTLNGNSFNSREAASIINAVNLPEMITASQKEYESLAIQLAQDPDKLKVIKDKLSHNLTNAQLYDTEKFTKNIELAYLKMCDRHYNGLQPDHIYIDEFNE